jgi:hypothetical protein
MNNKQRKEMIVNAIKWARNTCNIELISGRIQAVGIIMRINKACDPFGCLLLQYAPEVMDWDDIIGKGEQEDDYNQTDAIIRLLDVDDDWVCSFNCGFDGDSYDGDYEINNDTAYKLGQQIAKQTKPIAYEQWLKE